MSVNRQTHKHIDLLIAAGFVRSCIWAAMEDEQLTCMHRDIPAQPGIYVFVVDSDVKYVGSSNGLAKRTTLRSRLRSYRRHQRSNSESRPVHGEIRKARMNGRDIEIYTLTRGDLDQQSWKGLPIDLIIGLEAGLIEMMNPPWNRRGRRFVLDQILDQDSQA